MSSAGRILIMPKGDWKAETEYEMLDLVGHNGKVWLAKKTGKGFEPSLANTEYWMDMIDLTKVNLEDVGILSNSGGRNTTIKSNQFFFSEGRGRIYNSVLGETEKSQLLIQTNDSHTEMDKNSSGFYIRRDQPLEKRYGALEHDADGKADTHWFYGTHNKPTVYDIIGLREFIKQVIAEG